MLKVLDLFSGIGGFSYGLETAGGFETIAFCERDLFCQKVLAKHWPSVPIYPDIVGENFDGIEPDVITGGYPCQPFSQAGCRKGVTDDRHIWPEMLRIVASKRPAWVVCENVNGHVSMGLDSVLFDLENEGYSTRPFVIPALAVDAPHRRDRVWVVANSGGERRQQNSGGSYGNEKADEGRREENDNESTGNGESDRGGSLSGSLAESSGGDGRSGDGGETKRQGGPCESRDSKSQAWRPWAREPGIHRVVNGLPYRMDRNRALGNSIVPRIAELIGYSIRETTR